MNRILFNDFIAFISLYVKIDKPYTRRIGYYDEYEYHSILPDMDMVLHVVQREDTFYIDNISFSTCEKWSNLRKWINLDLYHNKKGLDRILFRISHNLCNLDWVKEINPIISTLEQCYIYIGEEVYKIILSYINDIYPGYISGKIREKQIKSVLD